MKDYKHVTELTDAEIKELKENYLCEHMWEVQNREPTMEEIVNVESYVTDDMIYEFYSCTTFSYDDFFCNQ